MQNFGLLILCFVAGVFCQRWQRFPAHSAAALNVFVVTLSLPALILLKIPAMLSNSSPLEWFWLPTVAMWIVFLFCWLLIHSIGKRLNWSRAKTGALILTTGLANTSFVGIPLLQAVVGDEAISYALLADQPGSFLILSTLGVFVASMYSGAGLSLSLVLRKIISFPPFVALLLCLPFSFMNQAYQDFATPLLESLAGTLVPLALFSVGFQSRFSYGVLQRRTSPLLIGLGVRLVLIPSLFLMAFYSYFHGQELPLAVRVTLLEAGMATQITSAIVANEFHLDGEIANLMVAISIPLSLVSIPLWNALLMQVF